MSRAVCGKVKGADGHDLSRGTIQLPKWHDLVKTATWKDLAPYDPDWYYVRAAAIARQIYLKPNTGVGKLRKLFGGLNRGGMKQEHFGRGCGQIIRTILHQLEGMKVVEKSGKG